MTKIKYFPDNINTNHIKSIFENNLNVDFCDCVIAYGGDGTLIDCFYDIHKNLSVVKTPILPIRNYGLCDKHNNLNYVNDCKMLNHSEHDVLIGTSPSITGYNRALAEITIRNKNMTQAIRFNVYINNKLYANNVIGDGIIICTVLGGTGYFRSVSNTIFKSGIGVGFINTTQHISNLIISNSDIISIEMVRGIADIAFDKYTSDQTILQEKEIINIQRDTLLSPQILIGYDIFMCQQCRNIRHSAYVNDTFNVLN